MAASTATAAASTARRRFFRVDRLHAFKFSTLHNVLWDGTLALARSLAHSLFPSPGLLWPNSLGRPASQPVGWSVLTRSLASKASSSTPPATHSAGALRRVCSSLKLALLLVVVVPLRACNTSHRRQCRSPSVRPSVCPSFRSPLGPFLCLFTKLVCCSVGAAVQVMEIATGH